MIPIRLCAVTAQEKKTMTVQSDDPAFAGYTTELLEHVRILSDRAGVTSAELARTRAAHGQLQKRSEAQAREIESLKRELDEAKRAARAPGQDDAGEEEAPGDDGEA